MDIRQIVFRGKVVNHDPMTNPENGWVEGYYLQDLDNGVVKHYIFNCPMKWEVDADTVGQFTGVLDKNGKEIYEGDVLFVREWENLAMRMFDHEERELLSLEDCKGGILHESQRVVYFEEGSMCAGDYYMCTLWDKRDQRHQYPIFEVELLGNIHDNPNFLSDDND